MRGVAIRLEYMAAYNMPNKNMIAARTAYLFLRTRPAMPMHTEAIANSAHAVFVPAKYSAAPAAIINGTHKNAF